MTTVARKTVSLDPAPVGRTARRVGRALRERERCGQTNGRRGAGEAQVDETHS